ncbi:MAG: four helix bundle protein [Phycisphaerales bacterium JB039]
MGRLREDFLHRIERFCDAALDECDRLENARRSRRLVEQFGACSTSVGANAYEAAEAVSVKDFRRALGVSIKELSESKFWIRLFGRRGWIAAEVAAALEDESDQLRRIIGAIRHKTDPQ